MVLWCHCVAVNLMCYNVLSKWLVRLRRKESVKREWKKERCPCCGFLLGWLLGEEQIWLQQCNACACPIVMDQCELMSFLLFRTTTGGGAASSPQAAQLSICSSTASITSSASWAYTVLSPPCCTLATPSSWSSSSSSSQVTRWSYDFTCRWRYVIPLFDDANQ